jgi:hypothetical protein
MTARTATITPSVARGRTVVVIDSYTTANFAAIGNLRRDITELSNQRRRFEQAHELAHHVLAQEETNQTGMGALLDAYRLLQQFAPLPAVEWPTSLPGTVTAPAVDLVELTHALPEFRLPAWRSGTPSTASMLAPIDTAQTGAAPVAPAQRITLKTASPDATFLRFIARLVADLSIAMVRLTDGRSDIRFSVICWTSSGTCSAAGGSGEHAGPAAIPPPRPSTALPSRGSGTHPDP